MFLCSSGRRMLLVWYSDFVNWWLLFGLEEGLLKIMLSSMLCVLVVVR